MATSNHKQQQHI